MVRATTFWMGPVMCSIAKENEFEAPSGPALPCAFTLPPTKRGCRELITLWSTEASPFGCPTEAVGSRRACGFLGFRNRPGNTQFPGLALRPHLLSIPYEGPIASNAALTPALLRLDPMFDPLRNDPRFQILAQSPAPKADGK